MLQRVCKSVRSVARCRASVPRRALSLSVGTMNSSVLAARYAVRGELVIRAEEYRQQLTKPNHGLPFDDIILCNIGNPQGLLQKPISFFRQVLALTTCPELLKSGKAREMFPSDVVSRAEKYLSKIPGGTGSYSNSQGVDVVRHEVAEFISQRDGYACEDIKNIFLTDGASPGVKMILNALIRDGNDGVLIPIPQYPLYSASIALLGGHQANYYLDESAGWGLKMSEVDRALKEARSSNVAVRALVVINPGNPTGQCLPEDNIREIVDFAASNDLVLMADEVYQANIYDKTPFTSFRKVVFDMKANVQLASFHSVSKGFIGECGRRGGYMELHNFPEDVRMELYKLASINLCSNLDGQVMTGLMVNPPKSGEPSFEQYEAERDAILESLKRRAKTLVAGLNAMDGVTCNVVEGAMYAFPQITLPAKAVEAARAAGKQPDTFYCLDLLDKTGICVVPGSGFGQRDGTWHFRTTILPGEDKINAVVERMSVFHREFMNKYK